MRTELNQARVNLRLHCNEKGVCKGDEFHHYINPCFVQSITDKSDISSRNVTILKCSSHSSTSVPLGAGPPLVRAAEPEPTRQAGSKRQAKSQYVAKSVRGSDYAIKMLFTEFSSG